MRGCLLLGGLILSALVLPVSCMACSFLIVGDYHMLINPLGAMHLTEFIVMNENEETLFLLLLFS